MPVFFRRDRARIVLTEDAISVSRYQIVAPVSQPQRQRLQKRTHGSPSSTQFPESYNGCVRPGCNPLPRKIVVQHHVHGVEIVWRGVVASKYVGCKFTLQRSKTEAVVRIAVQEELNQPVTETANAVVQNDRVGGGRSHLATLRCYAYTTNRTGMPALQAGRKSANIARFALQFRYVVFDFRFFQQIDARPLLASDGAAKFG